jgi:hypothetical protein
MVLIAGIGYIVRSLPKPRLFEDSLNHLDEMEASLTQLEAVLPLAQLRAVLLRYMNENSQAIQDRTFALPDLHEHLLRERSRAPSVEKADKTSGGTVTPQNTFQSKFQSKCKHHVRIITASK